VDDNGNNHDTGAGTEYAATVPDAIDQRWAQLDEKLIN
jgi:hypothetical protein